MSTGRLILLNDVEITNTAAPKVIRYDKLESEGSLVLFEPANPYGAMAGADNGAAVKNIVSPIAAGLHSGAWDSQLTLSNIDGVTKGLVERTEKGGLHFVISQDESLLDGVDLPAAAIAWPAAFRAYIYNNPENHIYISTWSMVTRGHKGGTLSYGGIDFGVGGSGLMEFITGGLNQRSVFGNVASPTNSTNTLGSRMSSTVSVGTKFNNHATSKFSSGNPANATSVSSVGIAAGNAGNRNPYHHSPGGPTGVTMRSRWESWILYRLYVEDLTVSGRTYAEVDALDHALYEREVLTPGGRYYGDTYTDPATLP